MKQYKTVDEYIEGETLWQEELKQLRRILISTETEETVKWGAPCYTWRGKMLVGMGSFKSYFGLWFFQGALLSDPEQVLINAQEGRTKAMRQWRMGSKKEIKSRVIRAYVKEAIAMMEQGREIKPVRDKPIDVPPELKAALARHKKAAAAFNVMTKGRQREFTEYISDAKRDATKVKRLEKIIPIIADGRGLNDKYRTG